MKLFLIGLILVLAAGCGGSSPFRVSLDDDTPVVDFVTKECFGQARKVEGGWDVNLRGNACLFYNNTTGEVVGQRFAPEFQDGETVFISDQEMKNLWERALITDGKTR